MAKDGNAANPVSPPTTAVFLNLSAYMYQAYDTAYASTTLQADTGFVPLTRRNGTPVVSIDDSTGLYAQAFVSTAPGPKQVVIAYEGTQLPLYTAPNGDSVPNLFAQGQLFTPAQIVDDLQLYAGQKADSFQGSASFARDVISIAAQQGIKQRNIYVTGHSLGAAEAAFAAAKTGLSGVTFASPGINAAFTGRGGGNVTNYVDAGDPIANYANDGLDTLAPALTSTRIKHFGNVIVLPNQQGQEQLQTFADLYQNGGSSEYQSDAIYGAIAYNGQYHHLSNYAQDLGVTLSVQDGSNGSEFGFYPGSAGASSSSSQANVDMSYIAAAMTGGGVPQSASSSPSASNASVLAASNDTHTAHAMGVKAHHAG